MFKKIILSLSFFLQLLILPTEVRAQLNHVQRAESPFRNHLKNPGGEQSTRGWAASGSSVLASETATYIHEGLGAISWDATAASETLTTNLVEVENGSGACLAEIYYYGFGTADVRVWIEDNATNVLGGYTAADTRWVISNAVSGAQWGQMQIPFSCPDNGNSTRIKFEAQGNAAIGYIDSAYLGRDFRVGTDNGSELVVSASRTTSDQSISSTSATTVIYNTEYVDKYSEFSTSTGVFTAKRAGVYVVDATFRVTTYTASERIQLRVRLNSTTKCYTNISVGNGQSLSFPGCHIDAAVGDTIDVQADSDSDASYTIDSDSEGSSAKIIIRYNPSASSTTLRGDTTDLAGWATSAGTASCNWGALTSATPGAFSADADCPTMTTVGNALTPATKIPGMIVPKLLPGKYMVIASGSFYCPESSSGAAICGFAINDGTTTGSQQSTYDAVSKGVSGISQVVGTFEYTSTKTNTVFQVYGSRETGNGTGANIDGDTSGGFEIRIIPLSQSLPRPFIPGSTFYGRSSVVKMCVAELSLSGSSSETTDLDGCISSVGNYSGGIASIGFTTGYFSSAPTCFASRNEASSLLSDIKAYGATTSGVTLRCREASSATSGTTIQACSSNPAWLLCIGNN